MKLYGSYTSPFVRHLRIALAQENLAFEFIDTDYDASAQVSPTAKVPYFEDGALALSDSSSILKYVREAGGKTFPEDVGEFENYTLANTALDTAINLFLLGKEGVVAADVPYLARQQMRLDKVLKELDGRVDPSTALANDASLRCACLLDWARFRQRFSLDGLPALQALLAAADTEPLFLDTAPPA